MRQTAVSYLQSGLCVLPALLAEKRPALSGWKHFQQHRPTEQQVRTWVSEGRALCVLTGAISGNLEMIDFDHQAELFSPWRERVNEELPGLVERLVIERSQSQGKHVIYRCQEAIGGNRKLAQRVQILDSPEPIEVGGKPYVPRRVHDHFEVTHTLIETRGEGGLFLCQPSAGYTIEQGSLTELPVLTQLERSVLIEAACTFNEAMPVAVRESAQPSGVLRPGDDFNERGDVREWLSKHGWEQVRGGENEYWRRPGKEHGWSATLRQNVLFVFSSNAAPFEPDRGYAPFTVYALLEHGGDFNAAAVALRNEGYGQATTGNDVDLSQFKIARPAVESEPRSVYSDPGPLPIELLRIPGFVSEVMDHCLETAPYPNQALAFCGALALQAMLAGRKVRDPADNRTNLYLLALAFSSVGKDWPRKLNAKILHRIGMISALGEKFASGEGIQDALLQTPAMLYQTDEIDGLLETINKSQDARYENMMGILLTLYSAANTIYPMRRKAGKEHPGTIDQPCLVVYGTAIPTHYYRALSERMLTNGFFARTLIVESGPRSVGQEPSIIDPPQRVLETAQWWTDLRAGLGNLDGCHPQPLIVPASSDARELLTQSRLLSEAEYRQCEARNDPVGTTVWGRVPEHVRKLALLYAISVNHQSPCIDEVAVQWATTLMLHQTRRMLFMAESHVAENPFHSECLRLIRKLREAPQQQLAHSVLLKRMKVDAKIFQDLISTLEQQGDVMTVSRSTGGRPQRFYVLRG